MMRPFVFCEFQLGRNNFMNKPFIAHICLIYSLAIFSGRCVMSALTCFCWSSFVRFPYAFLFSCLAASAFCDCVEYCKEAQLRFGLIYNKHGDNHAIPRDHLQGFVFAPLFLCRLFRSSCALCFVSGCLQVRVG